MLNTTIILNIKYVNIKINIFNMNINIINIIIENVNVNLFDRSNEEINWIRTRWGWEIEERLLVLKLQYFYIGFRFSSKRAVIHAKRLIRPASVLASK